MTKADRNGMGNLVLIVALAGAVVTQGCTDKAQVARLEDEVAARETVIADLQKQLEALQAELERAQRNVKELSEQRVELMMNVSQKAEALFDARAARDLARERITNLEDQLEKRNAAAARAAAERPFDERPPFSFKEDALAREVAALKQSLELSKRNVKELVEKNRALEKKIKEVEGRR